jgi:hypothetical protein
MLAVPPEDDFIVTLHEPSLPVVHSVEEKVPKVVEKDI